MALLETKDLSIRFGGLKAVDRLNLTIEKGQLYGLIGPNGAGKTTVFNMLTGVYQPTSGTVTLDGVCLNGKTPVEINKLGIARTFQNIRLFGKMSVLDNVRLGLGNSIRYSFAEACLHVGRFRKCEKEVTEKAIELLKVFDLDGQRDLLASNLPYGKQRKLEIARAMATDPKLLLLDEPAAGMNPQETLELTAFIRSIRDRFGLTIFLIEHHMNLVMDISDRIYVIDFGKQIAAGVPAEIQNDQRVIDAYLGVDEDA